MIGVGLAVDHHRGLGSEFAEVGPEFVADLHRRRALRLPSCAGERAGEGEREWRRHRVRRPATRA